jgi:hypothetical protein
MTDGAFVASTETNSFVLGLPEPHLESLEQEYVECVQACHPTSLTGVQRVSMKET